MEGWYAKLRGRRRRSSAWSYRQETVGSNVSSRSSSSFSGTIVSTADDTSSGSHFSSFSFPMEAVHFDAHGDSNTYTCCWWEEAKAEDRMHRIRSLVLEFFSAPSPNFFSKFDVVGDITVVDRWLTELGVGWLLSLHLHGGGASVPVAVAVGELERDARSWIRALDIIAQTICFTRPFFPVCGSVDLPLPLPLPAGGISDDEHEGDEIIPYPYRLALFIQEAMLKILTFVDVVVACDPSTTTTTTPTCVVSKLITLLGAHDALSSYKILTQYCWATSVEVTRIENAVAALLSEYTSKLGEATRSTVEEIRAELLLLEDGDDSSASLNPQGSSDIHRATRSAVTYINFLQSDYLRGKHDVSLIENVGDIMSIEMVSGCLLEKLAKISESFPDQGLGFLFLLNNSYYLLSNSQSSSSSYSLQRASPPIVSNDQIEGYMERFIQVSWAPLLSCLSNTAPLCLGNTNYSPLSKFESEFQKIYSTQKQCKVPDPELRRRLRQGITYRIIPAYTEYIEDNEVTSPKFSPQELKAMLQELFEG